MTFTLTTKEIDLLKDMKGQEQLCIEKYDKYAQDATAPELKQLFTQLADGERTHLATVNEMLSGKVSSPSGGSSQSGSTSAVKANYTSEKDKKKDTFLCSDMLSTEKHVSALYNTGVFEFSDVQARTMLNHIQSEEQQHGQRIYEYMNANGMYQ